MKKQLEKIERTFTALRADVMISKTNLKEREKYLTELNEQENQAKEEFKQEHEELKNILAEAKMWASILKIKLNIALLLLSHRELKHVHWHIDQMVPPSSNR